MQNLLRLPPKRTSERPKVLRTRQFLRLLTSKCASRHNGVHFFNMSTSKVVRAWCALYILTWKSASCHNGVHFSIISTSKSGLRASVFYTFDLEICFLATTACAFSTSQLPKVVRRWCVLCILTWKCSSRHNCVQFLISDLVRWLRTRRFSEPTFRSSGATNLWKNKVKRDFPTFSRACIFFLITLSLPWFSLLFSSSLTVPTSAFPSVHIVGSLTSKLPSIFSRSLKWFICLHLASF